MEVTEVVNAKKVTLKEAEALQLARASTDIYAAKGKQVVHLNLKKDQPDDETLVRLLLGPTGNLRAPTLRVGKKLIVGFNEQTYSDLLAK